MAEEENNNQSAPEGKGKNKLVIIAVVIVALLAIGGGAAFFLLSGEGDNSSETVEESVDVGDPVYYVNIAQPFLFNVEGEKRGRLVQIKVQLLVRGKDNEDAARHHSPLIESTLLSTFSAATLEQLTTGKGRVQLREQASSDVKASLEKSIGEPIIDRVLFTDFVVQ
ncbi:flagellar basal body-associated protein FliL [Vibrio sp.]|nr:flagellar basal body-associated protein FliL [Vibrio sp.]